MVRAPTPPQTDFPFLPEDLVAQNIDVVLNRRSCMAAALRIIEENIPEVRPLSRPRGVRTRGGVDGRGLHGRLVSNPLAGRPCFL